MIFIHSNKIVSSVVDLLKNSTDKLILTLKDLPENFYELDRSLKIAYQQTNKIFLYMDGKLAGQYPFIYVKEPLTIPNLQVNLVLNDQQALVFPSFSSSSIQLGFLSETEEEYQQFYHFYVAHIHEKASNPSAYFLLDKNIINEPVLLDELLPSHQKYKGLEMFKSYFPISSFFKSLGYKYQNKRVGKWLYWHQNGFLDKVIDNETGEVTEISFSQIDAIKAEFLYYSFVNILGGLYQVPLKKAELSANLQDLLGDKNRELFFQYLQRWLQISFPACALHTLDDIVNLTYDLIIKKQRRKKFPFIN